METSFLKTPGQAVTSNRQLNGWAFWVIKYFWKREIKAPLTAYWNLTTSKVPRRDPGSLENGSQQSESKKATTTQATMRTLGQPAMEEKRHLRFNGWGQRKEKGRKTKWQNWTVHQESSWRALLTVWIMAHIPLWAPGALLRLDPEQQMYKRCQEEQRSSLPLWPAGPALKLFIKGKVLTYYRSGRKCKMGDHFYMSFHLVFTLWLSLGVKSCLNKGCISPTGTSSGTNKVPIILDLGIALWW